MMDNDNIVYVLRDGKGRVLAIFADRVSAERMRIFQVGETVDAWVVIGREREERHTGGLDDLMGDY